MATDKIKSFLIPLLDTVLKGKLEKNNEINVNDIHKIDDRFIRPIVEELVALNPDRYHLIIKDTKTDYIKRIE